MNALRYQVQYWRGGSTDFMTLEVIDYLIKISAGSICMVWDRHAQCDVLPQRLIAMELSGTYQP